MTGGGAATPELAAHTAAAKLTVRSAARPRTAAVRGAGLAALAALRRAAASNG